MRFANLSAGILVKKSRLSPFQGSQRVIEWPNGLGIAIPLARVIVKSHPCNCSRESFSQPVAIFGAVCVDERGALWERVSGPFQSRSVGANSRKATKHLTLW